MEPKFFTLEIVLLIHEQEESPTEYGGTKLEITLPASTIGALDLNKLAPVLIHEAFADAVQKGLVKVPTVPIINRQADSASAETTQEREAAPSIEPHRFPKKPTG